MERSDHVLAQGVIDRRLAADAGIHLGDKAGGYLHEVHAPHVGGGDKTGQIADHASPQRQDPPAAVEPGADELAADRVDAAEVLGRVAAAEGDRMDAKAGLGEALGHRGQIVRRHWLVGDDGHDGSQARRGAPDPQSGQDVVADVNLVRVLTQGYVDAVHTTPPGPGRAAGPSLPACGCRSS